MKHFALALISSIIFTNVSFAQKYRAKIFTNEGNILIELYDSTPKHRDNFVKLARKKFYNATLFHRVIPEFMIQGGDPDSRAALAGQILGNGDIGYTIPAEFIQSYFHRRGALAQARDDNPAKASSGCQFYIVTGKVFTDAALKKQAQSAGKVIPEYQKHIYETDGGAPHLDGNYTVYGQVLKGMDVADKIVNQPRDKNDRPKENQVIKKIKIRKRFLFIWL